ncbi:hypothetical protein H4N58_02670 [Mumia sp. ZJ1417]|uniref:hypothetical protein n=1 Tax=unclassified Mumia TaxID=2621872 RepID=UPI00141F46C2|nr:MULTISPECIES: hypothetical protein [unclassified Mumia]QMW66878.1 hypothetical protein H4N58_02670 [Mumia sp. ZJ1417]
MTIAGRAAAAAPDMEVRELGDGASRRPLRANVLPVAGALAFAYVLARPVTAGNVLYPLLAVGAIACGVTIVAKRRPMSRRLLGALLIVLVLGAIGSLIGVANPGFISGFSVWVIAPVLFASYTFVVTERGLRMLLVTAAVATSVTSALLILYVQGERGTLPDLIPDALVTEGGLIYDPYANALRYHGLSTLVGALPMWMASLLVPRHALLPPVWLRLVATLLCTLAALHSGRRGIVVAAAAAVVMAGAAVMVWRRREGRETTGGRGSSVLIAGSAVLAVVAVVGSRSALTQSSWDAVVDFLFGDGAVSGNGVRREQAARLLQAWGESPWWGQGFGARLPDYLRSVERPWNFELQYHMLIFQVGLLGLVLLLAAAGLVVGAVVQGLRRRPDLFPVVVVTGSAMVGFLVANATNPYLQAPGHLWAIALFLACVNVASTAPTRHEP